MVHGGVSVYWAEGIHTTEFCSKTKQHGDRTVSNVNGRLHSERTDTLMYTRTNPQLNVSNVSMQISWCGFLNREDQISFPTMRFGKCRPKLWLKGWFIQGIPCRLWQIIYVVSVMEREEKKYSHKSHKFLSIICKTADATFLHIFRCKIYKIWGGLKRPQPCIFRTIETQNKRSHVR